MQKFEGTVITDNGLNLLTTVNGGDDKIQYTKAVLASDDFTQASATAIQKITDLKIKMSSSISINSRINDTINLSASFTNETITEDFDFYCIGWYAKGVKDSTEYLIAVSPSTVKQTMPASSNNAATAAISPKYAMTLSRSAEVVVNTNPAGSVTKEYVDNQVNALIAEGIINNGSIVSTTDDCNKMITTSYHLVKGSLPLNAPDGFSTNGQIIVYGNKDTTDGVTQLAYDDINGVSYVRSYNPTNNQWSTWDLIITKSQLNAVLPTDIARTGETNEFKAKNTFDVDPVNKDGNSYGLAKDIDTKVTDNGDNSIEINKQAITPVRDNKDGSINFNGKHITPADDSKVVHSTDMRKPASDVAGIEEVSTLQTQVDNSAVGTNLLLGTGDNSSITGTNTSNQAVYSYLLVNGYNVSSLASALGTQFTVSFDWSVSGSSPSGIFIIQWNGTPWGSGMGISNIVSSSNTSGHFSNNFSVSTDSANTATMIGFRLDNFVGTLTISNLKLEKGSKATDWCPNPDDKVNVADMRKPASDVAGLEDITTAYNQGEIADGTDVQSITKEGLYQLNGISLINFIGSGSQWGVLQVIHQGTVFLQIARMAGGSIYTNAYAGAPLSWLGWHKLSDDSKVAHLSGANNFDTTPTVNNNPLLLASSLPSDLARTGQAQTFTQPQTFSIAPTIKDASTSKGDNQAATMADLKSVENSAWHFLKTKDVGGDFDINMLYFKDYKSDYIRIIFLADSNVRSKTYSNYRIIVDMSKVITSFSDSSQIIANLSLGQYMTGNINRTEQGTANFVIATISGTLGQYQSVMAATDFSSTGSLGEFRGIDFKVNGFI
ncbi:pyocin knob domain-containing protein [Lentilactobacillus hilgardii]|nr:pyocin knob domain-containing protein [Lentilactobacillus hilgardii]MCV3742967.1 pyocin knob domain-containing protein [Lentilactobacillus hilgardii]